MLRKDFQHLAEERIRDAEALLQANRYGAARYLAGLAVECAIKARIAGQTREHEFPDKQKAIDAHQHNLEKLLGIAGLSDALISEISTNPAFKGNWGTIRKWTVEWRYDPPISESESTTFLQSITDPVDGILSWLRAHW